MKTDEELQQEYETLLKEYATKPLSEIVIEVMSLRNIVEPLQEHNKWLRAQIQKVRDIVLPLDFLPRDENGEVIKPRRGRPRKDDKYKSMKSLFNETKED